MKLLSDRVIELEVANHILAAQFLKDREELRYLRAIAVKYKKLLKYKVK